MDIVEKKYTAKEAMQLVVECCNDEVERAAQVITIFTISESERKLFVRMFSHWLHKNRKRIFVLTDSVSSLQAIKQRIVAKYKGIAVVETATLEEHGASDDKILNRINGAEADCIIASVPREIEEAFMKQNRKSLNVKVWLGLGCGQEWKKEKNWFDKIKKIFSDTAQKNIY